MSEPRSKVGQFPNGMVNMQTRAALITVKWRMKLLTIGE
jgi:hypothetical protein